MSDSEATNSFEIRREPITSASAQDLIRALNSELSERYPEQGANHFRLDPDEVSEGRGVFLVLYETGVPIACGALRRLEPVTAEIKRMYVIPAARGRGVAWRILSALEAEARRLGAVRLVLETGERQSEAVALYKRAGFVQVPRFGEYEGSPLSLCMGKDLT